MRNTFTILYYFYLICVLMFSKEFGVRRQRSHTSVQLERLQRNMIKSANVRHVKWELTPVTLTGTLIARYYLF